MIQVFNNTASVVATRRALQSLGKGNLPIVVSAHNGLLSSGKALGDLNRMEGSYEVYGMAIPTDDPTAARAFFEKLRTQYKTQANFTSPCIMGLATSLLTVRAVEQVVKIKGPAGVTGADVRTALQTNAFPSELTFGVLPNIKFSNDAPFPTSGLAVNIGTIEKGMYKLVEQSAPVPNVNKW